MFAKFKYFYDMMFFYHFQDYKYKCTSCGFQCKSNDIFWEHKYLHFYINMIKRKEKRKDILRQGLLDKNTWINSSVCKGRIVKGSKYLSTHDSVKLFLERKFIEEEAEGGKQLEMYLDNIYPMNLNNAENKLECLFCKSGFEIRYINKYNYWFYINIVKESNIKDLSKYIQIIPNNEEEKEKNNFLHEECIVSYIILVSSAKITQETSLSKGNLVNENNDLNKNSKLSKNYSFIDMKVDEEELKDSALFFEKPSFKFK